MTEYLDLRIEKEKLLELAREDPCWGKGLEKLFPDAFKSPLDLSVIRPRVCVYSGCEFYNKGFTLDSRYNWHFLVNMAEESHLIPEEK